MLTLVFQICLSNFWRIQNFASNDCKEARSVDLNPFFESFAFTDIEKPPFKSPKSDRRLCFQRKNIRFKKESDAKNTIQKIKDKEMGILSLS